ncbi:MAG TPA: hypothetical protein VGB00_01895, partial [Pyrinomonadaceae bacterium]
KNAFGDDTVYMEKYLGDPRHIEFQVFGDGRGEAVHLGERDCSLQRRHQKLLEEAPSPVITAEERARMGEVVRKAMSDMSYRGAGTIEFLYENGEFYFIEMNTRLQVEHPVTELVTGIDLVREQIRVAWGEPLSFTQEEVTWNGHAIECRVYAEDPDNNFLPSPGRINRLRLPHGNGVRDDGGVYEGAEVSIYYDPMISKFAAYGKTREEAIDRLRRALQEYEVGGIKTTLPFFREIVEDAEFIEGKLDTGFISRWQARRAKPEATEIEKDLALIAAALAFSDKQNAVSKQAGGDSREEASRWVMAGRTAMLTSRL